jgi:hypothetical protein
MISILRSLTRAVALGFIGMAFVAHGASQKMTCAEISNRTSAKPKVVIVPIAHIMMPADMEQRLTSLSTALNGRPTLVLETRPTPDNDVRSNVSTSAIKDLPQETQEYLLAFLGRSKALKDTGFPNYLMEALPLNFVLAAASNECLKNNGISRDGVTENRLRKMAEKSNWEVDYIESADAIAETLEKIPPDIVAATAKSYLTKCKEIISLTKQIIRKLGSFEGVNQSQAEYRSSRVRKLLPLIDTPAYRLRDESIKATLNRLINSATRPTIIAIGLDHVPALTQAGLGLSADYEVRQLCN